MDNRLTIFDTTLRDGEQAPGCSMTERNKLKVAHMLAELGVDVIEAGFPAASQGDFEAVSRVAREVDGPTICGLARCNPGDIEKTARALEPAAKRRIHVFIATSPIHREHKLKMDKAQVLERAVQGVKLARESFDDVEFSAEDALRTEWDFLAEVCAATIAAGATTINVPDTVGYTVPSEMAKLFRYLRENVPGIDAAKLSVHCHDDLGLAVANSLAAVRYGATQVECTINGLGERAGNCSLEELVMALRTRSDYFDLTTGIDTTRLYPTSRLVSSVTGMLVARNKAIVGANAFAHEAGIHQHGMLAHESTYEIMRPQDVGISKSNLVLGKHSGRHAFRDHVANLGFELDDKDLERAFQDFKNLADKKKEIYDADIEALVLRRDVTQAGPWKLASLSFSHGDDRAATAAVRLEHIDGRVCEDAAVGNGAIEAAFRAIEKLLDLEIELFDFDVRNVSVGEDAQGEVHVSVRHDGESYHGLGLDTDIIRAATRAFLQAMNQIYKEPATATGDHKRALTAAPA